MKRKNFLQSLGLVGASTILPNAKIQAEKIIAPVPPACTLIPTETAGPFPLDLTANTTYFRQDIRETKTGTLLRLKLKVTGTDNCLPMANLRVNIWHCDKDGLYSGYSQQNNQGQAGLTYLRGYQMTDANGEVNFVTIFPGWYTGRLCHIHFQVYVSSVYAAISQLTFPIADKNALYAANPSAYTKGADPLNFNTDNIFSDGYNYQLATLTPNATLGGYDSYLEVGIKGSGTTSLWNAEPETGEQFKLNQNFPNPYTDFTRIAFNLTNKSAVKIDIFDLQGKNVAQIDKGELSNGDHQVMLNMQALGIPTGNYIYQLQVENSNGLFRQCKMMTAAQ